MLIVMLSGGEKEKMQQADVGSAGALAANDARLDMPKADPKAQEGKGLAADDAKKDDKKDAQPEAKADEADAKVDEADAKVDEADKKADDGDKKADDGDKIADDGEEVVADKREPKADSKPAAKKPEPKHEAKVAAPAPAKKADPKPAAKKADPKPAAKKAEPKPAAKPAGGDKLSKDEVQSVIRSSFAQVRTCSRTSAKKGKMNVQFTIKGNGRVNGARVMSPEYQGTPTAACVLKVVNGLKFRETGSDTPITYPFSIQ